MTSAEGAPKAQASALGALLLIATLGEGGAQPDIQLLEHALVGVIAVSALTTSSRWRPARSVLVAFAAFLALAAAGGCVSPYGYSAFLTCWELLMFTAIGWSAARCGEGLPRSLAPWLAVGIAAHGLAAVAERALGDPRPATTFLNTNHFAAWLVAASFVVAGALPEWTFRARVAGMAAIGVGAAAFAAAGSRGALIALSAAGAAWLLSASPFLDRRRRRAALAVLSAAVLLGAIGAAWRFAAASDPFAFQRLDIWRASGRAVAESPWLGTGPGQFRIAADRLNFPLEGETLRYARSFRSPHSDLLRAPCEFGIPAAAAIAITLALVAVRSVRRRFDGILGGATMGAIAALTGLFAQGAVDDLTGRPALYLLAAALVGGLVSRRREPGRPIAHAPVRAGVIAAAVLAFLVLDVAPWRAWRGEQAVAHAPVGARLALVDRALSLNPYVASLWMRRAEVIASDADAWSIDRYGFARESAEHAIRLSPQDATLVRGAARIDALACRTIFPVVAFRAQAARRYDRAGELAPHDPFAAMEEGTTLLLLGDASKAAEAAARAEAIEPRAAAPHLLRAEALEAQGNAAGARDELEAARALEASGRAEADESPYHAGMLRLPPGRAEELDRRLRPPGPPATPGG